MPAKPKGVVEKKKKDTKNEKIEMLSSGLLEPGAMFCVTDRVKDNTFSPGSLGFVSFIKGLDESYQNVAKIRCVMIRRGKGGKPRLMNATICVPVFNVEHENFPKLMPEPGARKYYMDIERYLPLATEVMEMKPLYFMGYAVALAKRIKHMSDQCKHKKWPEAKSNPINVLKKLPDYFEDDPDTYLEKYANAAFRDRFIEVSRKMVSSLIRMHLQLDITRADVELNAAEFLLFTNKGEFIPKDAEDKTNEYQFTDDNDMLQRTVDFHDRLRKDV